MSQSVNGDPEFLVALNIHGVSDIPYWKKLTQIMAPLPAQAFVFIDEHPDYLVDAHFGNPAYLPNMQYTWYDMPADRHNQGANLSFADGHVARWRWHTPKIYMDPPLPNSDRPDFLLVQSAMKMWTSNDFLIR
jgi:prepilin-type processing-associated H-X9-DG protein